MKVISLLWNFIIGNLTIMHTGTLLMKIKSATSLALGISPIAYISEKIMNWTLANEQYVWFVFIAIAVDHILGTLIHLFIKGDFSIKTNITGLITKVGLVIAMGFLFEGMNVMVKEDSFVEEYLTIVLRLTVFLYPAGSAFVNSSIITGGKFPPIGWMNKFKKFQEDLSLKHLKDEK